MPLETFQELVEISVAVENSLLILRMKEMNKTNMFVVGLMILKKSAVKL